MKELRSSDEAVVGIVVTVLLIGLILAVIVMLNTVYVPQWLEESEAAHMEEVSNQFTKLKYALDIQSLVNDSTSVTTPVKLGTREIPFFNSGRTFGSLQIDENSFNMTITNVSGFSKTITADSIRYSSGNSYFVNQQYIYEAGSLILSQGAANVLYGRPSIFVTGGVGNESLITFVIVNTHGIGGKTSVSGYGTYPVYTQVTNVYPSYNEYSNISNVSSIAINTEYTNAWNRTINSAFRSNFLLNESHFNIKSIENGIEIEFTDSSNDYYDFRYRIIDVSTQISSGIAE